MGQKIAVLGAGPMGLAVAYELVKNGHHPVIFEADDRIGGMTATFDFDGTTIERYYHFHCISDHAFLTVLDELGLAHKMHWVETKMGYWYQNQLQAWGNPIALLKFKGLGFLAKFRYALFAFLCTKRNNWKPLDSVDAVSWIKRWVGAEAYEVLWRKLFEFKFYDYTNNLSAAWIWSRIRRIGRSRYDFFREKLGYLDGGSHTLLEGLKKAILDGGGELHLKAPVQEVVIQDGKVVGVKVSDKLLAFDKVISTVPMPYVPRMMPSLPQEILNQYKALKNIAVVCVIVKLKKALTENFWLNTNDEEMDIPGLVEYTNLRPMNEHIVYVPFYMPGEHPKYSEPDENFTQKVKRYLQKINPQLKDDDFVAIRANRYRFAQPICEPEFMSRLPSASLPVKGLWVADTSFYYPEDRGISESIDFGRKMARDATAY